MTAVAQSQAPLPGLVPQPGMDVSADPAPDQQAGPDRAPAAPPAALAQPGVQIPFPNFQIQVECARQAGGPTTGRVNEFNFQACRRQEFEAHDMLLANWGAIPTQIILGCMSLARGTGFGSYAVLATCVAPQFQLR